MSQGHTELAGYITSVQDAEKEKLMLVAALHLDIIQDTLTVLQSATGGKSIQQQQYLSRKITEVENTIVEAMDNITSLKCDLLFNLDHRGDESRSELKDTSSRIAAGTATIETSDIVAPQPSSSV